MLFGVSSSFSLAGFGTCVLTPHSVLSLIAKISNEERLTHSYHNLTRHYGTLCRILKTK